MLSAMQRYLGQHFGELIDTDDLSAIAVELGLAEEGEFDPGSINSPENQYWLDQESWQRNSFTVIQNPNPPTAAALPEPDDIAGQMAQDWHDNIPRPEDQERERRLSEMPPRRRGVGPNAVVLQADIKARILDFERDLLPCS